MAMRTEEQVKLRLEQACKDALTAPPDSSVADRLGGWIDALQWVMGGFEVKD